MKMESFEHLSPKGPNPEQEGLQQLVKQEIIEYARGLDPAIIVDINPLIQDEDSAKLSGQHLGHDSPNGLRFVFKYNGQEKGFIDQDVNDKTVEIAEDILNKLHIEAQKFTA